MSWLVRFEGGELRAPDDLTLDELEAVERVSEKPWVLLNPLTSMPTAKALLALVLIRAGVKDEAARERVGSLTGKAIAKAFEWRPEEEEDADLPTEWADGLPDPKADPERASTGGSSSAGERSSGPRTLPEPTASVT